MDRAMRIALVLWQRINFGCDAGPPNLAARSLAHHRGTRRLSRFLQGLLSDTHLPPKRRAAVGLGTGGQRPGWYCRSLSRRQEIASNTSFILTKPQPLHKFLEAGKFSPCGRREPASGNYGMTSHRHRLDDVVLF